MLYAFADPAKPKEPADLTSPAAPPERRLYLYLIGIEVQHSDLSPGSLLLHAVLEYAQGEGFTHLDLLRGGEEYKRLWGTDAEETYALHRSEPGKAAR